MPSPISWTMRSNMAVPEGRSSLRTKSLKADPSSRSPMTGPEFPLTNTSTFSSAFTGACLCMVEAQGGGETGFEIVNMGREMARAPVLAAGGIVLRRGVTPLIAVVRLCKRNEWVLPKGKLDDGETARDAALREVVEETGHEVSVHEFLGTLVYESGGRSKAVHYWRMETNGEQVYELMEDVKAVGWLARHVAVAGALRSY